MALRAYNRHWSEAQLALDHVIHEDLDLLPKLEDSSSLLIRSETRDRQTTFQSLCNMYIRYSMIFKKLEECYELMIHPQKRRLIRDVLEGSMGRILELKHEMVRLENTDFHFYDESLADLKLNPADMELPIPKYFLGEMSQEQRDRRELVSSFVDSELLVGGRAEPGTTLADARGWQVSTLAEAIEIIQVHERARQARRAVSNRRELMRQERLGESSRGKGKRMRRVLSVEEEAAARLIQSVWRGYQARVRTKKMREDDFIFLGMASKPEGLGKRRGEVDAKQQMAVSRQKVQEQFEQEYEQAQQMVKDKLVVTEGVDLQETLQEQIRQWFLEVRDATGKFPEYPDDEDGGSATIFKPKDPEDLEKELRIWQEEEVKKDKKKGEGKKDRERDRRRDLAGSRKSKQKKDAGSLDDGFQMQESNFIEQLAKASNTYKSVWKGKSEKDNPTQKPDLEMIKLEKRVEVEKEVRKRVDELMREELKLLKLALDKDRGRRGKVGKKKKKGKKAAGKKGKKGKKKRDKDLTENRTPESLIEELCTEGIIRQPAACSLSDFLGDYNHLGSTLRHANVEPMPSLADIRRIVMEYAILPLGSKHVHDNVPQIKSLLLTGPRGSGKQLLVNAICRASGAVLFDVSAENIAGRYPGKAGLAMLIHLLYKVAVLLQPAVIFVKDAEKMFLRKTPKTDLSDPKRLRRDLPKVLKRLSHEDRILILGTSSCPFDSDLKALTGLYQKFILIPRPDYASRFLMWREMIESGGGVVSSRLDVSSLAKVSDGYNSGAIKSAISIVMTDRRKALQNKKPLQAIEFVQPLAYLDPVYREEEEAFKNWWSKTPLGRRRTKMMSGEDDDDVASVKGRKSRASAKSKSSASESGTKKKVKKKKKKRK